jgi:hypothetical protein
MTHVAEERLEDFARQNCVLCDDFAEVHNHIAECPLCQDRLSELNEFVSFMRSAPGETEGQIVARHQVSGRTIFLVVTGSDASVWEARVVGADRSVDRVFLRGDQAKMYLETWFDAEFADHRCVHGCGKGWH